MLIEGHVDVLVIGAGPTGVMCANALARAGVNVRIIDKRPVKVSAGQADGITPRTIEVLQSYGLAERLTREGNQIYLYTVYSPAPNGGIECAGRIPFVTDPNAPYPFQIGLKQAAIEALFLDSLKDHGVEVERPKQPSTLEISENAHELSNLSSYPVKVTVEHLNTNGEISGTEIIRAKFVVGADGAHSWVRKILGIRMEGEQTDYIWGVMDVKTQSNFPDIRNISAVHSTHGSCLLIPRENEKNRLYIQLSEADLICPLTAQVDKNRITPQKLLSVSRKILHPYKLADPKEIDWWSIYTVGQRIASSYSVKDRVFIAGDACHTHSAKGGQGMNAGINDAHNLAWKLAQVLRGWSRPSLLNTYEHERRMFAQSLINSDKEYAALYSQKPRSEANQDGVSCEQYFRAAKTRQALYTGFGIHYTPSVIADPKHQKCAKNLIIGERMHPYMFVRAADLRPIEIQHLLPADVRFKLMFFVGYLTAQRIAELDLLAQELDNPSSFLRKYGTDWDVFDVVTIIATKKHDMNYLLIPTFFLPHWTKVLLDDTDLRNVQGGRGYENFGIDPERITVVVVRPDGFVGTIVPSAAMADLEAYFGSFMVARI